WQWRGRYALGRSPHRSDGTVFPGGRRRVARRRVSGSGSGRLTAWVCEQDNYLIQLPDYPIRDHSYFPPKIGLPKSSVRRFKYLLFSWQIYSVSSPLARQGMSHATVNGFVYAPGSSISAS